MSDQINEQRSEIAVLLTKQRRYLQLTQEEAAEKAAKEAAEKLKKEEDRRQNEKKDLWKLKGLKDNPDIFHSTSETPEKKKKGMRR